MRLVSWNVNGIRAALNKGMADSMDSLSADIICLQEVKARAEQVSDAWLDAWPHQLWNAAEKPGYSGVLTLSKHKPLSVSKGLNFTEHDQEGRVCTMEFERFFLVNCYTPNSKDGLTRLPYRRVWNEVFRKHMCMLAEQKPVIFCGDLNVAHEEIDIARPDQNHFSAGFSDEEREDFTKLLQSGFTDTFRHLHPDAKDEYSWWSYRGGARARNVGWRIDYFCVSDPLMKEVNSAAIHQQITGSDHCPVSIDLNF